LNHLVPLNWKAKRIETTGSARDVRGYACSDCGTLYAPGWETGSCGQIDPCPWVSDLPLCASFICWWSGGSVPGLSQYPGWLDCCNNYSDDWTCLCVVPD
jgi:hypothetical protein